MKAKKTINSVDYCIDQQMRSWDKQDVIDKYIERDNFWFGVCMVTLIVALFLGGIAGHQITKQETISQEFGLALGERMCEDNDAGELIRSYRLDHTGTVVVECVEKNINIIGRRN